MSKIRSKQIDADEIPINPHDVANKEYVDSVIGSGGTAMSLTIEDEGILVSNNVRVLNFVGNSVKAINGNGRVDIYIPQPEYASHFNTQDGTTDARITPYNTISRYISIPTTEGNPYKIGNWSNDIHDTIRSKVNTLTYTTSAFTILDSGTTYISASILDVNNNTILNNNTHIINGNYATSSNGVTITTTNLVVDYDKYKVNLSVVIQIASILPQGGRFSVIITHNNGDDGVYTFEQLDLFRDSETLIGNFTNSNLTIVEGTTVQTKYISGVNVYTTNTTWNVHIDNVNNLNSRTYPTTPQLIITDSNFFISSDLLVNGSNSNYDLFSSGWTNKHDNIGAIYNKNNWITDQTNQTNWNHINHTINATNIIASIYDWSFVTSKTSNNYNYIIDTLIDSSDRNSEMFRTENNSTHPRLKSNLVDNWNSVNNLNIEDDGNGLQILSDRLVYPTINFTTYQPNISNQPNYTTSSGIKTYYRKFETNGYFISNGIIVFNDHNINESDLSNVDIKFEFSLDNGITWFIIKSNYVGGILTNGDDSRIDKLDYGLGAGNINNSAIKFTLGQGGSTTYLHLKISYSGTVNAKSKYIGGIDFIGGNWI